jgi:MSHA pilin protein MshD
MCTERRPPRRARGLTLIELILFIVVVGAGTAGLLAVLNFTVSRSADPFPVKQALAVAESMLEEILQKSYTALPGTGSRAAYDDVDDYNGFSMTGVTTITGAALAGLTNYKVDVAVTAPGVNNLNGSPAKLVTVTVTYPAVGGTAYKLSGYRTNY